MVLNGTFSDDEMKRIIGMANVIVRFLSEYIVADYCNLSERDRANAIGVRDTFSTIHFSDWKGIQDITQRLIIAMDAKNWLVDETDIALLPYSRWEAYWLMRGTTALHAAYEVGNEYRSPQAPF